MSARGRLAAALLAAIPCGAAAQDAHLNVFLPEKSYVATGTPKVIGAPSYYAETAEPALLAEAQMLAHFALRRGLLEQEIKEGGAGRNFNLFLTTQFRLRGLNVPSGPVRSPSFMPRFIGQLLWASGGGPGDEPRWPRRILGATLTLGHHSNGGDGCVFVDERAVSGVECTSTLPPGTPASERRVRVDPGNFSTNYVELGLQHRWGVLSDAGDGGIYWTRFLDLGGAFQYNHNVPFPLPGGAEGAFADLYGHARYRAEAGGMQLLFGRSTALRGRATFEFWFPKEDVFPGVGNHRFDGELFFQPTGDPAAASRLARTWARMRLLGIGGRYVRGQDYYNTQFVRSIEAWQFVLSVDPWSAFLER